MTINLTPWFILWALITSVVVSLAFWRLMMGLHHSDSLHLGKGEERAFEQEVQATRTMTRIELWGKTLTVVSLILIAGIGMAWFYNLLRGA
jgi:hypothetical protein